MAKLDDLMKKMEATKDGCNHDCKNCEMFLPVEDMCFHSANEKWQEWNYEEHMRFGDYLKGAK